MALVGGRGSEDFLGCDFAGFKTFGLDGGLQERGVPGFNVGFVVWGMMTSGETGRQTLTLVSLTSYCQQTYE